jgi:fucose 4-O-acetylase-like acetyltransferase
MISLGVPYLIFSIMYWVSKVIMSGDVNNQVGIKELLLIPIVPLSTLWFIYALLIFWFIRMIVCKVQVPHEIMIISSIIL